MNAFRAIGDMLHLLSILIILVKIRTSKSCAGISLKTQELYAVVFVTRYLDLFFNFVSVYNSAMKLFFLGSSLAIIYFMRYKYKASYDAEHDTAKVLYLMAPMAVLALVVNQEFTFFEVVWTFSIYLEAVAIWPQLVLLQRTGNVENLAADYIFCLGAYRAFYLFNWIYRFATEDGYTQWIVWISGLVQTLVYIDFFYYYVISKYYGKKITLPS